MATSNGDGEAGKRIIIKRPVWQPDPQIYEAWARAYVHANYWRVRRVFEYDDAIQECRLIYVKCWRQYEGRVDNAAWFMALYMRAVTNDFNTFARRNQRLALHDAATVEQVDYSNGPLLAVLASASEELREVLRVIAVAPSELLMLMLDGLTRHRPGRRSGHEEAAVSRALCRLARIRNVRDDLLTELRSLLRD